MVSTRSAREVDALRRATMREFTPDEPQFDDTTPGVEGKYTETVIDPQWLPAWKMLLDGEGEEYGIPVLLPRGQWDQGGPNALMNQKRPDGGYWFTLVEPDHKAPPATIECIYEKCGDAHIGGKRKWLHNMVDLIEHVETFHAREAKIYRKYLDEIQDSLAMDNERLQRLRVVAGVKPAAKVESAFYCETEGCVRFFDSEQGRRMHMQRDHTKGD